VLAANQQAISETKKISGMFEEEMYVKITDG
jgi:hypothetical protein